MPTSLYQALQQEGLDLSGERDAIIAAADSRAATGCGSTFTGAGMGAGAAGGVTGIGGFGFGNESDKFILGSEN